MSGTSIKHRLLVGTIGAVVIAFVVVGLIVNSMARSALIDQFDIALDGKAQELLAQVEIHRRGIEVEVDPRTLPADELYEIWNGDQVLAKSPSLGANDLARTTRAITAVALSDGRAARQLTLLKAVASPDDDDTGAPLANVTAPHVELAFAHATAGVETAIHRIALGVALVGCIGGLIAVALLLVTVRLGLRPVTTLAREIGAIEVSNLKTSFDRVGTAAELRPIAERLDDLLARLAKAFARERELTAEIAHELRTPLAGLKATLELALLRERPAEEYRTALEQALAITADTARSIESLLSLARLDAGQAAVSGEPVDLDQQVREVLVAFAARASARKVAVVTELEPVTITTDRDKLRLVLTNLLDNAISYVDDGGEVRIALVANELQISNTGCTLAPEQARNVFQRFWRSDEARSGGSHIGLGLSLCEKLVALLEGTLGVEVIERRFIATLRLP
jgi:two-component system sensor histidine kinase QseC